ncbi:MAG: type IV pilus twitching motility protein PilT [bacterium]
MTSDCTKHGIDLRNLLETMLTQKASDLHVTPGIPPRIRIQGEIHQLDYPALNSEDTRSLTYDILSEEQKNKLKRNHELDLSFGIQGLGRFRANIFHQRGTLALAIRSIPFQIPCFEELNLPPIVASLCEKNRGLILISGPTGSGKSTTLAAMIDWINAHFRKHIITIEDPIEYLHHHKKSIISQRELHSDTRSFAAALRSALREDPDVVMVGEMRDLETVEAALHIAETGHLTLATLHTDSCIQAINRILDIFVPYYQQQVRTQLSFLLEGILCQQLIPARPGDSRVLALEIMIPNPAIRNLIRENQVQQIYSVLETGSMKHGMQTMNQSLFSLYRSNLISEEKALGKSSCPDELIHMMRNHDH